VILLADEIVAHLQETVTIAPALRVYDRIRWPQSSPFGGPDPAAVPPMPAFGEGANLLVTGSTHDPAGVRRTTDGPVQEALNIHLAQKILAHQDEIDDWETYHVEGAERVVLAYGSTARSALWAVRAARARGEPIGMLRLRSLWPFPDRVLQEVCQSRRALVVPEMNLGQISREAQRCLDIPVISLGQTDGEMIDPRRILRYLLEGRWER